MFIRQQMDLFSRRLEEPRRFLQVLMGPRQVGKTTLVRQCLEKLSLPSQYASADEPLPPGSVWIEQQWEVGRNLLSQSRGEAVLVLDEIQKIPHWSSLVKRLWDEDSAAGRRLKVVLLGSSPLLIQSGLTESLAGRFEIVRIPHWSYSEMEQAFGWNLEQFIFFGGYPGAAALIAEEERWRRYLQDSLVETTISRDILLLTRIDKPALLRRLFLLGCEYSGQILSYQKMLGQLHDSGNTTTLAHYLDLLSGVGMLSGLQKYSGGKSRQRGSSPKLLVLDTALMNSIAPRSFQEAQADSAYWGRVVETAIGAHLFNRCWETDCRLYYWREGNYEVDFIIEKGKSVTAIEVKSGRVRENLPGMEALTKKFKIQRKLLVGNGGIPIKDFLSRPLENYLE